MWERKKGNTAIENYDFYPMINKRKLNEKTEERTVRLQTLLKLNINNNHR